MGFLTKKVLNALWGVKEPEVQMAAPIPCERCRIARAAGKDACPEHHHQHPHAHAYHLHTDDGWDGGSGLDGRKTIDSFPPNN